MLNLVVCGRREAEASSWLHAAISISDIDSPLPIFPASPRLNLQFQDWDREAMERDFATFRLREDWTPEDEIYFSGAIRDCMTPGHASQICAFVGALAPDASLLIHCEAGVSRSAGVAAALRDLGFAQWDEGTNRRYHPNLWVKKLVMEAFRGS